MASNGKNQDKGLNKVIKLPPQIGFLMQQLKDQVNQSNLNIQVVKANSDLNRRELDIIHKTIALLEKRFDSIEKQIEDINAKFKKE